MFPLMLLLLMNPLNSHSLVSEPSPVALAKGIKNERELEGMRAAHVRDGVAMVLALSRLERDVAAGVELTEVDVDERITAARARQEKFLGKLIRIFFALVRTPPRLEVDLSRQNVSSRMPTHIHT